MSYRSRSVTQPMSSGQYFDFDDVLGAEYPMPVTSYIPAFSKFYEASTYSIPGPRTRWKSFSHYKREVVDHLEEGNLDWTLRDNYITYVGSVPLPFYGYWSEVRDRFGMPGVPPSGFPALFTEASGDDFIVLPDNLNELKAMSVRAMLPSVRKELSLLNSIFELKDFASLPRTIRNVGRTASKLFGSDMFPKMLKLRSIHDVLLVADDVFLQQQFNINPLISDILDIYRVLWRLSRRYASLKTSSGKVTTRHYMWRPSQLPSPDVSEAVFGLAPGERYRYFDGGITTVCLTRSTIRRTVLTNPFEFRAHLQYVPNYTEFQEQHEKLLNILDQLGVNFNPSIIWNAIPWTFVIDWVANVSRWLDDYHKGWTDPKVDILQYCWSYKQYRETRFDVKNESYQFWDFSDYLSTTTARWPTLRETAYCRRVEQPDPSWFTTSGLNAHEFTLGAALAFTKTKRRKSRTRRPRYFPPNGVKKAVSDWGFVHS